MEGAMLNLVVEAMSPIMGKLIRKLSASYLGGDATFEDFKKLHTIILPQIQIAIKATEEIPIDKLKPWLMDLKAATFEAEDVLDLYEYEVIKNKATSDYNPLQKLKAKSKEFIADMLPKTKLKKSLEKLKQSANEAKDMFPFINVIRQHVPQQNAKSQHSTTTVSGMSSPIFGRDGERYNIINMLINETGSKSTCSRTSIPVLAVLGIGGAGKTTFTQAVYNDSEVKSHFDMTMWVHVSRNFDVHRVTTHIIESAKQDGSACSAISNLDALQNTLEGILNSKKFLLVLDDIWCEDKGEWDKLLIPLNNVGDNGSRILITTRTEGVALTLGIETENLIRLKELKVEDCLSILKHYAFGDASKITEDQALANVVMRIACKLKNSLLAASLFSKGHRFDTDVIDDLVRIWIAEGFVEVSKDSELTIVEKGRQYFNELVSNSFFQSHPNDPSEYVIHDLLHDVAEKVSEGHCFRIEANGPEDTPPTTVHLSIVESFMNTFPDVSVLANLRTLMCIESHINSSLLDVCTKLRVLYCRSDYNSSPSVMPELPRSIGQLKHLRYLRAERVKQLPDSFGRLYHLQFLDLSDHELERVPKSFSNLVNLQCFLDESLWCTVMKIPKIGKLTLLQTLELYRVETNREFGIGQLKNLNQLRGSLEIRELENVKGKIEATEARLNQKKHLEELRLEWNRWICRDGRVADEEVLEGMEPHSNLKKLEIRGFGGAKTPSWMRRILPGLQSLRLIDCPNLTGVPHLPHSLKRLTINKSSGFEDLFSVFISFNDEEEEEEKQRRLHQQNCGLPQPFALDYLSIDDCYVLREKTFNLSLRKFDLLHTLELLRLPKLTSLLLGPNLRELPCIVIKDCKNLQSLEGIGALPHLKSLKMRGLPRLTSLLLGPNLRELRLIVIEDCENLQSLEGIGALPRLGHLEMGGLPKLTSLLLCPNLRELSWIVIKDCKNLQSLEGIGALPHLESLEMGRLPKLTSLLLGPNLRELRLFKIEDCENLQSLEGIGAIPHLEYLSLDDLPELTEMGNLQALETARISKCPKLTTGVRAGQEGAIADRLPYLEGEVYIDEPMLLSLLLEQGLNSIGRLNIRGGSQDRPFSTEEEDLFLQLTSIETLDFEECEKLPSLPANLQKLPSLKKLTIWDCPEVESLPNLPTSLQKLTIRDCPKVESLPILPTSLNELLIFGCPEMESLPNLPTSLNYLSISGCPEMESLPNLPTSLYYLIIENCREMESLPNLPTSLSDLVINDCPKMESLPNLPTSLHSLRIENCREMESLPNLPTPLKELHIEDCPKLKDKYGEGGPLHHKITHIPDMDIF